MNRMKRYFVLAGVVGAAAVGMIGNESVARADAASTIGDLNNIAGGIANFFGTYQAIAAVLDVLNIGQSDPQQAQAEALAQALADIQNNQQAMVADLTNISNDLNALGAALTWQINSIDRENNLADLIGDTIDYAEASAQGTPFNATSAAYSNSINALQQAETPIAFQRAYVSSLTAGEWQSMIAGPTVTNGLVYDWRLGVPALLTDISLRLALIASVDPNFVADGSCAGEINGHIQALELQLSTMVSGVQCGSRRVVGAAVGSSEESYLRYGCADIYTGVSAIATSTPYQIWTNGLHGVKNYTLNVAPPTITSNMMGSMRQDVLATLPLVAVQNMIVKLKSLVGQPQSGAWWPQDFGLNWSPVGDWNPGSYKGECPYGQPIVGVSRSVSALESHGVECSQSALTTSGSCYLRALGSNDNRGTNDGGWDWDPGSYKDECASGEYVQGVSQTQSGVLDGVLCCPGNVLHVACDTQVFYNDDSATVQGTDWDFGSYKGQCPYGQYVAGISSPAFTSVGALGAAHAVLCCSVQ
jgi:hypothetical protein